ncbi:hypothetical protein SUGI_0613790 [Cryptomeria japonica]|nr:hypothetical protein SUGI_0613790 [Cryptomeria japonica]
MVFQGASGFVLSQQPQPQPQPAGAESKGLSNQSASGLGFLRVKDPEVICSRSHSLVGPSPRPGLERQPSKFSKPSETVVGSPSSSLNEVESGALSEDSDGGAFGKVFQVRRKGTTDDIYAMKVMRKDKIIKGNHVDYMKAERDILTKVDHPFIVQLRYSFQTKSKLYLILDFINGGHLFFQLYRQGIFSEELARIYTAEIVSAVTHLHKNGIIHRDLKPENILMDAEGHVMLTDFGLAKEVDESMRSNSMCGTTEYMAPEIILSKGHDKAADWWSVGVLLYEMVTGQPPFTHNNRQKLQDKIIKDKIKLPSYLTSEAHSLLKGLLQKDPSKRLGSGVNGSDEIKRHKWFKIINWKKLDAREIQPTFRPNVSGKDCIANFDERWTNMPPQDSPASTPKSDEYFKGYTYVAPSAWLSGPEKESH